MSFPQWQFGGGEQSVLTALMLQRPDLVRAYQLMAGQPAAAAALLGGGAPLLYGGALPAPLMPFWPTAAVPALWGGAGSVAGSSLAISQSLPAGPGAFLGAPAAAAATARRAPPPPSRSPATTAVAAAEALQLLSGAAAAAEAEEPRRRQRQRHAAPDDDAESDGEQPTAPGKRKRTTVKLDLASESDDAATIPAEGSPRSRGHAHEAHGAAPAPGNDERTHREQDKEWAALTTWLRMNLHHPRTAKRKVLFVGARDASGAWSFRLNESLCWDDLSPETKERLRTIGEEVVAAYRRKYPDRPQEGWAQHTQKYRPPGSAKTHQVPLTQLLASLHRIWQAENPAAAGDAAPRS